MPEPNTSDSAVSTGDKNHPKIPWDCYFKVLGLHKTGGQGYQPVPFALFEPNAVVMILEKNRCRALLGPGRNAVSTRFQWFREDLPISFDLILGWQACLWMQHTLDFLKVFDLILNDNLNWYDTNLLWQMLKGLTNDKRGGLNAVDPVGAALEWVGHIQNHRGRNMGSHISRFGVFRQKSDTDLDLQVNQV